MRPRAGSGAVLAAATPLVAGAGIEPNRRATSLAPFGAGLASTRVPQFSAGLGQRCRLLRSLPSASAGPLRRTTLAVPPGVPPAARWAAALRPRAEGVRPRGAGRDAFGGVLLVLAPYVLRRINGLVKHTTKCGRTGTVYGISMTSRRT